MRITFGIGTGYDKNGMAISYAKATELTRKAVEKVCKVCGGCFYVEGDGGWMDVHGKLIVERGLQLTTELASDDKDIANSLASILGEWIRELFNQTSVVVSVSPSSVSFIEEVSHGNVTQAQNSTSTSSRSEALCTSVA